MRIGITFLLLCFVCLAVSQPLPPQTTDFTIHDLEDGEVQLPNPAVFNVPATATGYVTITITADWAVDVCFQEGNYAASGTELSITCNSEGYIPGNATTESGSSSGSGSESDSASGSGSGSASDDAEFAGASTGGAKRLLRRFYAVNDAATVTTTTNLYLRTSPYTISAAWTNQGGNNTGDVTITIGWTPCTANGPIGPQCLYNPVTVKADEPSIQAATPASPVLIAFKVPDDAFLTLLTFIIAPSTPTFALDNSTTVQAYVRRDAVPFVNEGQYDANNNGSSSASDLIGFTNPEGGHYYLLIFVTENLSLNVTVQTNQNCNTSAGLFPAGTSGGCVAAIPIVANGTANTTAVLFADGVTVEYPQAPITYFLWNTSDLLVGVVNSDHSDEDAPMLYASTVGIPSSNSSEFKAVQTNTQVNFLNVQSAVPGQISEWIISVESSNDFEIWAGTGCANNCSNVGICDPTSGANGICNCPEHYKDFECGTKTLKTIYIVLIAIGGAIVLAIAIGVPVGCYIKNRKRARYERV